MSERVYKSAGVFATETDLSQPTRQGPVGTPAGVIGTANYGPAFVPVTIGSYGDFAEIFGPTDGEKFGPLAVYTFLQQAQALTYLRVLGVGDGLRRSTGTGKVTNAGFAVGAQQVQGNGVVGLNTKAVWMGDLGRTYFLGCFMSQSLGSTVFSDAGIQPSTQNGAAAGTAAIVFTDAVTAAQTISLTDANGHEVTYTARSTPNVLLPEFDCDLGSVALTTAALKAVIDSARGHNGSIITVISTASVTDDTMTFTQRDVGSTGNTSIVENFSNCTISSQFSGGKTSDGKAIPMVRGIILAASGVIPQISGTYHPSGQPSNTVPATAGAATLKGGMTGSVNVQDESFVLLLNGHINTDSNPNVISASFNASSNAYFANQLNRDPQLLEQKGHVLYSWYNINNAFAVVTGSGITSAGRQHTDSLGRTLEDVGFITTGSQARDTYVANTSPNYESFEDRFATAKTPFFVSQDFGGSRYNLFRIHAVSDGERANKRYKITIRNINPAASNASDKYGSFDLIVRDFFDRDGETIEYEQWLGLSLDPSSDKYIARVIGDKYMYFDFDQSLNSQKLVVKGDHTGNSARIRVEISTDVQQANVPDNGLPMGFRGVDHLVTSGSGPVASLGDNSVGFTLTGSIPIKAAQELPVRYRNDVKEPASEVPGSSIEPDSSLCWGVQFAYLVKDQMISTAFGSKLRSLNDANAKFDSSIATRTSFLPQFSPGQFNFSIGNNPGQSSVNGTILDCDSFHNNLFALEKIRIRTGSDGYADPEHWASASFIRKGAISADHTNKTRALKVTDFRAHSANRTYSKYTVFMQGGFDGTNIFNKDQYNLTTSAAKREIDDSTNQGGVKGNTVASFRKAIDIMGVKADVDINLLAIPGIRSTAVSDYAIDAIESRFDAFYIMDIEQRDGFNTIISASKDADLNPIVPHVKNTVTDFASRGLNSSFAAAYFPDIVIQDPTAGSSIIAPPSVAVLGSFATNDSVAPWFAPAGFTRGIVSSLVENTTVNFNRDNLDTIYSERINPVVKFEGRKPVIWGQKTLLANASALDRINVRRLLINVRRKVRAVANSILFEPNRQETLDKFNSLVKPILSDIQKGSGIDRYKVIIDTTTTTQSDVENNTIRGKIFLQPTRTAEFVALDFTVTNAGNFDSI